MTRTQTMAPTDLYQGINGITGALMPGKIVEGRERKGGPKTDTFRCVCMSASELSENVSTQVSLELGIGPFSFNLGTSSSKEFTKSEFTAYVVLYTICKVGERSEEEPVIPASKIPGSEKDVRSFARRNGDSYVSSISQGASYHAIYCFTFESMSEKEKFGVKAGLGGMVKAISFGGEAQTEMESFKKNTNASCTLYQVIHGTKRITFPSEDKMGDFALNFPKLAEEKQQYTTLNWGTAGYERANDQLEEGPFRKVINNRKKILGRRDDISKLRTQNAQLTHMQLIYARYTTQESSEGFKDITLSKVSKESASDMKKLKEMIEAFNEEPTSNIDCDIDFSALKHGFPKLEIEEKIGEQRGYGENQTFTPLAVVKGGNKGFIRGLHRIGAVGITPFDHTSLGQLVGNLTLQYTRPGDEEGFKTPDKAPNSVSLSDGMITKISGRSGSYIDKLFFETESTQTVGTGGDGGDPFSLETPKDWFLLYLRGHNGGWLDFIQPVYARFKEASWEPPRT